MLLNILALVAASFTLLPAVAALDNGLALTPPMGWLSWERFRCNTDCVNDPNNCIGEKLYQDMASALVSGGYDKLGYTYVNIDDCWAYRLRDFDSDALVPDPDRFPSGMAALGQYIHNLGLKFGIYGDFGTFTCGGYPGTLGYYTVDSNTFASWGIDSLKLDGCYANIKEYKMGYPNMSLALNATGRPILYACSWPAYYVTAGIFNQTEWSILQQYCNYWRNYNDINDDWDSVTDIIEWWGDNQAVLAAVSGPGHWNDADMIICGDFALSVYECKVQFALWSIWSAPLYLSVDLRTIGQEFKNIITNKAVIAIDQDALGKTGLRVDGAGCSDQPNLKNCNQQVWAKPLANGDIAVVLYNKESYGVPTLITASWKYIGAPAGSQWTVTELYSGTTLGTFTDHFSDNINTHDANIYRLTPA